MNLITYHPAFDLYHCKFRLLQILSFSNIESIEVERLQIWDFYFLFPNEIKKQFTFTKELTKLRKIFNFKENPYDKVFNVKRVYERMKPYQLLAIKNLISYNIIDKDLFEKDVIKLIPENIPDDLITELSERQKNVIKLISSPFNDLPLFGNSGFKKRTGLIEYKYDKSN